MATEELKALEPVIEELKTRGIQKGKEEAEKIVSDAKAKASEILAKAKEEADALLAKTKETAEATKRQMESELRAATQVALTAFRQAMERSFMLPEIDSSVKPVISKPEFLEQTIAELVKSFASSGFGEGGIEVLLPENRQKELESSLVARLKARAGSSVTIRFDDGFECGFKIGPSDGRFVLDLSEEGFQQIFVRFMSPRFRKFFTTGEPKAKAN